MKEIECEHWSACGVNGGGCCAISKHGDKPSHGVCLTVCMLNNGGDEYGVSSRSSINGITNPIGNGNINFNLSQPELTKESTNPKEDGGCTSCKAKGLKRLLKGSAALLKAELGIDACPDATIIDRRNLCESCEHYDFGVCDNCGCFCAAKVKLKSETCPVGRW